MINVAICDDDEAFADYFAGVLERWFGGDESLRDGVNIEKYASGVKLLDACDDGACPDIAYIDIELGSELGFDIARNLIVKGRDPGIIYVTNHDAYMQDAFVCRPLGFIRKNRLEEDLQRSRDEIMTFISKKDRTYAFMDNTKAVNIAVDDIISISAYNHYLEIRYSGKKQRVRDTLKRVEYDMQMYGFIRVSRSAMVNPQHIVSMYRYGCAMDDGSSVDISRERYGDIRKQAAVHRIGE